MTQEKILKCCKILKKFHQDEVVVMTGIKESVVRNHINEFVEKGILKKLNENEFVFIKMSPNKEIDLKLLEKMSDEEKEIVNFLQKYDTPENIELYLKAPISAKKQANKYLKVLVESRKTSQKIRIFLDEWNEKFPSWAMSLTMYYKYNKTFLDFGIKPFIHLKRKTNTEEKDKFLNDLYSQFKKLYFSDFILNKMDCYIKLKNNFDSSTLYFYEFPPYRHFVKRVNKEYSLEEQKRIKESLLVKFENNTPCIKRPDSFYLIAQNYLEKKKKDLAQNEYYLLESATFNKHIFPYFGHLTINSITVNKIIDYCDLKLNQGQCVGFLHQHLLFLSNLLEPEDPLFIKNFKIVKSVLTRFSFSKKLNILTEKKLKKILKTAYLNDFEFYLLVSLLLSTGMFLDEALGLKWKDINFKNNEVTINKKYINGQIIKSLNNKKTFTVKIPDNLLKMFLEKQENLTGKKIVIANSFIFYNERASNLEMELQKKLKLLSDKNVSFINIRDTYASILIKNKTPIHFIQRLLRHRHVEYTIQRYKTLLDKQVKEQCDWFSSLLTV